MTKEKTSAKLMFKPVQTQFFGLWNVNKCEMGITLTTVYCTGSALLPLCRCTIISWLVVNGRDVSGDR